jgi:rod shape-determining protein MreC
MNKISFAITKNRNLAYLATCVLLSLLLLILPGGMKSDFSAFIFRFTYAPFYALSQKIKELQGVYQENKKLQQKIMELTLENSKFKEEHLENLRLRALLEFRTELEYHVIPAEVVATEADRPLGKGSVLINKGKEEGIKRNMPILNPYGLVGRIEEVLPHHSTVQLMLNPNFRVSALDQRSRVFGIIKPLPGPGSLLKLDNVPMGEDVEIGDPVVSAGLGGVFPSGLKIGVVLNVGEATLDQTSPYPGIFKKIEVVPSVNFNSLEELFVLSIDGKRNLP